MPCLCAMGRVQLIAAQATLCLARESTPVGTALRGHLAQRNPGSVDTWLQEMWSVPRLLRPSLVLTPAGQLDLVSRTLVLAEELHYQPAVPSRASHSGVAAECS